MRKNDNERSTQSEEKINVKKFLRKRWVVPAFYLIAAAVVLSSVYFFQSGSNIAIDDEETETTETSGGIGYDEQAIEVTKAAEIVQLPIADESEFKVVGQFYDMDANEEDQQAALVYYDYSYYPNKGIDYAHVDEKNFDVVASLSGTVIKAEKDGLLGYVVELNHDHGIVTHYHSLEDIDVDIGSKVEQGDVIGRAGQNLYNAEAGIHVHFEVHKDDVPLNPNDLFQRPLDQVATDKDEDDEKEEEKEAQSESEDDAKQPERDPSEDDEKEEESEDQ